MKTVKKYAINQKVSIKEKDIAEQYGLSIKITGFSCREPECTMSYNKELIDGVSGYGRFTGLKGYGRPEKNIRIFLKEKGRPAKDLALNLTEEAIDPILFKLFERDIAALEKNKVTGFYYNYRICNGGASYKDMSINDAEAVMVLDENGNYIGFTLTNLSNFRIVLTANSINQAGDEYKKDNSKQKIQLEEHKNYSEFNSGYDVFYGGLIFGKEIKSNETGYAAEGWG